MPRSIQLQYRSILFRSVEQSPYKAVFQIRDVLIRIRGSVPLDYGSGSCSFFQWLKGSRQWESWGVWNVSVCPNLARTSAIEVCLPFNFAVVFDFTYFLFPPSKAKWIGNVLPNRRNAAIRSMFFYYFIMRIAYWHTESVCVIRWCKANRKKKSAK